MGGVIYLNEGYVIDLACEPGNGGIACLKSNLITVTKLALDLIVTDPYALVVICAEVEEEVAAVLIRCIANVVDNKLSALMV